MDRIATNGVELAWDARGEGPPVLLIMGIGAQMILWPDGFVDALVSRGLRVLRFDNRDIGKSTWLDHLGVPPLSRMTA
ncbi:MAG: alpha/beta hydrolase, partial [Myxococcota bacterium]|nr:alpha/beta hydrolase [Myxococcota bacterium]